MRFHVVSLPHTQTTLAFTSCAFTEKVRKFCKMMHGLDYEVFLYSGEQNEAPCTEHVPCISETDRLAFLSDKHYIHASFDAKHPTWIKFNAVVAGEIARRAQPRDFICLIGGNAQKAIAHAHPNLLTVEFGIGYEGTFSKYRVWESYAWMHTCYGWGGPNGARPSMYDAVIPSYFEPELFPLETEKDDYFLFMGRLTENKGYHIAMDVCSVLGARLIVAGAGNVPNRATRRKHKWDFDYVGVVGAEERGKLMSKAKATFAPTLYIEPFGSVVPEAHLCGTPTITTDWGAFTELVTNGFNGWRCRTLSQFIEVAKSTGDFDNRKIHERALSKYSLSAVAPQYEQYFQRLLTLWDKGWYS